MTVPKSRSGEYTIDRSRIPARSTQGATRKVRCTAESRRPITGEAAVVETDFSGFITSWSRTAEHLYGFGPDEIIGMHISILYCQGDLMHGRAAYELNAAQSRGNYCASGWQQRKNAQQFWSYSESRKTEDGYCMFIIEIPVSDI